MRDLDNLNPEIFRFFCTGIGVLFKKEERKEGRIGSVRIPQQRRMLFSVLCALMHYANAQPPLPTAAQVAWQNGEIMALVHFNMATFVRFLWKLVS